MTFENQYELENYVSARDYPKELRYEMFEAMEKVRECISGGAYIIPGRHTLAKNCGINPV